MTGLCGSRHARQVPAPPAAGTQPCLGYLMPSSTNPSDVRPMQVGDVFVSCGSKTAQITETKDVSSWAVNFADHRLLIIRENRESSESGTLEIISLASRKIEKSIAVTPGGRLVYTCGTVMLVSPTANGRKTTDAISGAEIQHTADSAQTRCDEAGRTVATLEKATSLGGGPLHYDGQVLGTTVSDFEVSPNERFIGFYEDGQICIYDAKKAAKSCLKDFRQVGRMSVWDDGTVVAAAETSQACPLSQRLVSAQTPKTWPCPALFQWRGSGRDEMVQFLGNDPQFLPIATGKLLLALKP